MSSSKRSPSHEGDKNAEEPGAKRIKLETSDVPKMAVPTSEAGVEPSSPTAGRGTASSSTKGGDGRNNSRGNERGARGRGNDGQSNRGSKRKPYQGKSRGTRTDSYHKQNTDEKDANASTGAKESDGQQKLPKKKVALAIGYSGLGYNGSQINPGVKTIEGEVFDACVRAGTVSEDNSDNPNKVHLMRAARTDAGVSAAINILNLKLIMEPPSKPQDMPLEEHLNNFLPDGIRVWKITRVQGAFHARTLCDSRMYNYSLPTYCFLEPKDGTLMSEHVTWQEGEKERSYWATHSATGEQPPAEGESDPSAPVLSVFKQDQKLRRAYRMSPEVLARVRDAMSRYSGSHNFWNFTVGKEFGDRSCQRVMKNLVVSDPFLVGDSEWISLKFHGQSFMLHQIRKMVGLLIFVVRTHTSPSLIPECFGPARLNIPKAPALGLLLEQPHFDSYNRKVALSNRQATNRANRNEESKKRKADELEDDSSVPNTPVKERAEDDVKAIPREDVLEELREPIDYQSIEAKVEKFVRDTIVKSMHDEEEREDTYAKWLNLHDNQAGPDFDYLNAKGVIPPSAILSRKKDLKPAEGEKMVEDEDAEDATLLARAKGKEAAELEG